MANATEIVVTRLVANAAGVVPAANVLDTGTAAVTLPAKVGGDGGRLILEVTNNSAGANNLTVAVKAGVGRQAIRGGLGDLETVIAQNATKVIGPFETQRFAQTDGDIDVTFTPAAGTIAVGIKAFWLPKQ